MLHEKLPQPGLTRRDGLVSTEDGPRSVTQRHSSGTERVTLDVHRSDLIGDRVIRYGPSGVSPTGIRGDGQGVVFGLVDDVDLVTDTTMMWE
jgi:hypothetical protein